ncbi:MAG: C40 family peptidase [Jatrophihabitans sp.]
MAIRFTHRIRPAFLIAALAATAALAPTIASAAPASPHQNPRQDPSIATIQKQLGELALKNSQVVEQYNQARVLVGAREKQAARAKQAASSSTAGYRRAEVAFAQNVQARYEAGSLGAAGALLDSSSGPNYLDRLSTLNLMSSHDADVVGRVADARAQATEHAKTAKDLLASATKDRDALQAKRATVEKQIKKYQTLLSTLSSAQQAAYKRMSNPSVQDVKSLQQALPRAGSKAAQVAVEFALAQVGKPYVFGAAGPSSFDCSGLTMAAWNAGGVSLPHSAADQSNYGKHVSASNLQPGDLVFMYHPIGHVTIYIGDGMMVSAPTEGQDVTVVPLSSYMSDFVGATRLA